jgi:hypothetical protein
MNPLDELLVETKRSEVMLEHDRGLLRARAEAGAASGRRSVRGTIAGWLVRFGFWLDPRAGERVNRAPVAGEARPRA